MTTIFEKVKTALDTLSPAVPFAMDVYQTQGGGDLPDVYLAYSLTDSVPVQHADNVEVGRSDEIQVSIYKRGGLLSLPDVDTAMRAQGFTKGPARMLPFNSESGHFGLATDYYYLHDL